MNVKWTRSHVVALSAVVGGAAGCGSIWGFEDPIEVASTDAGPSGVDPSQTPGVVCVPPVPEGFQGPLSVFEASGSPLPPIPPCADKFELAYDANGGLVKNTPDCACLCEPVGLTCEKPVLNFFKDNLCTAAKACGPKDFVVPNGKCNTFDPTSPVDCSGADFFITATDAKIAGSCAPKFKVPPAPPTWKTEVRLCNAKPDSVPPGAQCAPGKIPVPAPALPFDPGNVCIVSVGERACPTDYPAPRSYFDPMKLVDERACPACACDPPTGTCGGQVKTYKMANCPPNSAEERDFTIPIAVCSDPTKVQKDSKLIEYVPPQGGPTGVSCAATGGGTLTGEVVTGPALTICCRL